LAKTQAKADRRPYTLDIDHPVLGDLSEKSPSFGMAYARAKLYEAEEAEVIIVSPDGNPLYNTEEGIL